MAEMKETSTEGTVLVQLCQNRKLKTNSAYRNDQNMVDGDVQQGNLFIVVSKDGVVSELEGQIGVQGR